MQSAANGCIARPSSTRSARYGPPAERPALGDDMKIYDPEKLASLPSPPNARIRRAAIVAGTLSAAVVLAWLGWNSLTLPGGFECWLR